ncbi:MAG: FAD-dependent oxidoreductase [Clostridiales bacterium]|nr:FAD-dependent oxidoreductase [Clostridiales bacterium]
MGDKYVIVGGVAGGATAATRLRRLSEAAEIVVFERGEYISYANCGLPYHVGGVIPSRSALLLHTPESLKARYNIDVRVKQEVASIDRANRTVRVRKADGSEYDEHYDKLLLSTGSSPMRPRIPGIDSARVLTLWTVPDADRLRAWIREKGAKSAVVVGGGFIGLEAAENLKHAGLAVSVVEMDRQVMPPLDFEMAQLLHEEMEKQGLQLHLERGVTAFEDGEDGVVVHLGGGEALKADIAVLAIGVKPNSEIAAAAGLTVNARGGIVVDEYLRTDDPDIYAAGDVIEVRHIVDGSRAMIPLAGPANKQGRIAADNMAGGDSTYAGSLGTSALKLFDLTAASAGLNEKALLKSGKVRGEHFDSVTIVQNDHAGYYPGAVPMTIKLLFERPGGRVLGAQIVGRNGVDKRIDVLATVMRLGGTVQTLTELELAYAPPYSSAKDPVNMAGFVAQNALRGRAVFSRWDAIETAPEAQVLDVREDVEREAWRLPRSTDIPLGQLRNRLGELNPDAPVIVLCAAGVRAYNAARILMQNGFEDVMVYPGGAMHYRSTHYLDEADIAAHARIADSGDVEETEPVLSLRVDCRGMQCPGPLMRVFEELEKLKNGDVVEVSASDPGFARDIEAWTRRTGNGLLSVRHEGPDTVALLRKGNREVAKEAPEGERGKTIIVFSGDLDRVLASLIIANGAAAMGRKVTMFFTFWGLNALRRPASQRVKKGLIDRMFGAMMPRGVGRMKLSKMHMLGMGTSMMKHVMKKKNVSSVEELLEKARAAGVRLVACTMSMDVMGIRREELLDGIEYAGVGSYLGDAEEADLNLFV